jgi:hypothetical protein
MNTIEKKSVNAGKYASKMVADNLIRAYKQERWAENSDRLGKTDSLSAWFSVEEIEAFLDNVKSNGGNGVRIHFGVMPEGYGKTEALNGLQTIVMVGNRSKDGSYETSKELFVDNNGTPDVVAYYSTIVCPPFCGGAGGGTGKGKTASLGSALIDRGEKGMSIA